MRNIISVPEKALAASEVEANLKAILMGGMAMSGKARDAAGQKMFLPSTQHLGEHCTQRFRTSALVTKSNNWMYFSESMI